MLNFVFMKVLITGATGLIGKALTQHLIDTGHQVNYLTSRKEAIQDKPDYKGFLWDLDTMTIDANCLHGVDTIIHLAGETVFQRWTDSAKEKIMQSRIKSSQLLIDALHKKEDTVKHIITASAIGIYPDDKNGKPMKENEVPPIATNFLADVCLAWESMGMQFQDLGLDHAILRIGIVLASDGGALEQMARPVKMYAGAGFGDGQMWQSWVAIHDLIGIIDHIATNRLTGVYNGVAPQPVRNRDLIESIGKVLKKPVFLPNVPVFIMKALLGEMATIVLASQNVSSEHIEKSGYIFQYRTIDDALRRYLK